MYLAHSCLTGNSGKLWDLWCYTQSEQYWREDSFPVPEQGDKKAFRTPQLPTELLFTAQHNKLLLHNSSSHWATWKWVEPLMVFPSSLNSTKHGKPIMPPPAMLRLIWLKKKWCWKLVEERKPRNIYQYIYIYTHTHTYIYFLILWRAFQLGPELIHWGWIKKIVSLEVQSSLETGAQILRK